MKDDFIWIAGDTLSTMRLYAEGAISLFENDAMPLTKLAHDHQEWMAAEALDAIGEGLYSLRDIIRQLQEARIEEVHRQTEPAVIPDKNNIPYFLHPNNKIEPSNLKKANIGNK